MVSQKTSQLTCGRNSINNNSAFSHVHRVSFLAVMDDRPHKAHRPAQSGAKADKKKTKGGKQQGFNEKVFSFFSSQIPSFTYKQIHRPLLQNQVEEQTVKDAATSSVIKLVFTSLLSTVYPMTTHHLSSLP